MRPIHHGSSYGELTCQCRGCGDLLTVFVTAGQIRDPFVRLAGRGLVHIGNGSPCGGKLSILGGGAS